MIALKRLSAPQALPVSLSDCKRDLRILDDDEDAYISSLIGAAVDYVDGYEGVLGHALITQTWQLTLSKLSDLIVLPFAPIQSIAQVAYYDQSNETQVLEGAYRLVGDNSRARLERDQGVTLPGTYDRMDAVSIDFVAGYGGASAVPLSIKRAIRLLVAHWFEHPTPVVAGKALASVPVSFDALISQHCRRFVA
ncbi:MAG: phage head-tail connector protein [Pseudomonadota bacterium]